MTTETALRVAAAVAPAFLGALLLDGMCVARGLLPPGFRVPWRRVLAGLTVTFLLAVGVFAPLGSLGVKAGPEPTSIATPQLFELHAPDGRHDGDLVPPRLRRRAPGPAPFRSPSRRRAPGRPEPIPAGALWTAEPTPVEPIARCHGAPSAAPAASRRPPPPPAVPLGRQFLAQFGYLAPSIPREIGLGVVLGIGAWVAVLLALMLVAGALLGAGRRGRGAQVAAGADPADRRAAVRGAASWSASRPASSRRASSAASCSRASASCSPPASSCSPTSPTASRSC